MSRNDQAWVAYNPEGPLEFIKMLQGGLRWFQEMINSRRGEDVPLPPTPGLDSHTLDTGVLAEEEPQVFVTGIQYRVGPNDQVVGIMLTGEVMNIGDYREMLTENTCPHN